MAEKGVPVGSAPPARAMGDAPPSYDQSMAYAPPGAAGGFAMPPQHADQSGYPKQQGGYVPVSQTHLQPNMAAGGAGVPPPQGGVPGGTPVIVQYVNAPNFGPHPVNMTCPHCQSQIRTSTDSEPGPMAWILAGILCVVGLWPCACIPCCIESLNSVTHKCPQCKNFLGRYKGGIAWVCACIPCCISALDCVTHKCPNCKNFLGKYKGGL